MNIGAKPKEGSIYYLEMEYGEHLKRGDLLLCAKSRPGYSDFALIKANMEEFEEGERNTNVPVQRFRHYDYEIIQELIEKTPFTGKKVFIKNSKVDWAGEQEERIRDYISYSLMYCGAFVTGNPEECDYYINPIGEDCYPEDLEDVYSQKTMLKLLTPKHKKIYKTLDKKFIILNEDNFLNYYFGDTDVEV